MLPNNINKTSHKLINHLHHTYPSIYSIQYFTLLPSTYIHRTHRHFTILQKQEESSQSTPTEQQSTSPTIPTAHPDAVTTGNEKHIEVHAFRSLITIAPDPDELDINELSLTYTEKKAAIHQKKNHAKLIERMGEPTATDYEDESDRNIKSMGKWSPAIAYEIWHSPPEVYDKIYGFESDCEPPDRHNISWKWLYKLWGYYSEREIRYRCALYTYMKAQRRCMNELFWDIFELENTFRVELQLLCLHIWFAKIRAIDGWGLRKGTKIAYKTFKIFFEQLPNRFGQHLSGSRSRWEQDCQQACLHFAMSLDHAKEDYEAGDKQAYAKVIWNELYLSDRDMQHDLLYLWTEYIVQELKMLESVSNNEFINGWWKWGNIPNMEDRARVRQQIIDEFENTQDDQQETVKSVE